MLRDQRDHPRSRGVYVVGAAMILETKGSSPLARGLRASTGPPPGRMRIIPARAGFTDCDSGGAEGSGDHPRSRGVYSSMDIIISRRSGSSPLARGLPSPCPGPRPQSGIIPARAGFTATPDSIPATPVDHPRSRGVYGEICQENACPLGSSPLARGLLIGSEDAPDSVRIIPARAGFTGITSGRTRWPLDHPRSRGVYDFGKLLSRNGVGSSPLARGLPCLLAIGYCEARIIPARAGFTHDTNNDQ